MLSGIDPCEKRNYIPGGDAWHNFFMTCSKLKALAIYVVKQACGIEDFKTLPYPGNNVIVVSNRGLKTGEKISRKGEFCKEMPDIN